MNRGRGNFTPSPRGRGRGGWSRSSPSSDGSSDRPRQTPAGAEQSSPNYISRGMHPTSGDSGERSWHRNDRFNGGRQTSGKSQTIWKPVAYKASSGEGSSPSSADWEARSPELNYRAEIVGGGLMQSDKSDFSSDCTKNGSADRSPRENHGSPHVNSSVSSGRSSQRNERPSGGSQTSRQWYKDYKQPQPVANEVPSIGSDRTDLEVSSHELNYRAEIVGGGEVMQSVKPDLFSDCTKKGSLDPSLRKNLGKLHANPSGSRERSSQRNERLSSQRHTSRQRDDGWMEVQPIAYKDSSAYGCPPSIGRTDLEVSSHELNFGVDIVGGDLSSGCTDEISKPSVHEKGPALDLDQSLIGILGSPCESSGGSGNSNEHSSSPQHSECPTDDAPFDICQPKAGVHVVLKPSLRDLNRERRNETKCPEGTLMRNGRSGMVLLKKFISVSEQVNIVKECRKRGLGTGGFYQPGYRDGAKLNLRMMCFGKNWDPDTKTYGDIRPFDGAKPPPIPSDFLKLVERSIKDSHTLISEERGFTGRAEAILPWISPDICLVNFYTTTGRLGLHQDRTESNESLKKGLPVVSISIGDSAEFLYGDERDVDKAENVTLKSGDVLIFGGESRLVFHGVSSILPNTAPKSLLKETGLRPGRLNLTFRQY